MFLNAVLLTGLVAVIVVPIIHLFTRRRFDVVEWGAMQFLLDAQKTHQRIMFDDWLLMLFRMLLIAILVLALAAPVLPGSWLNSLGLGDTFARAVPLGRDFVFVIDGSASMSFSPEQESIHRRAVRAVKIRLDRFGPNDRLALIQARSRPHLLMPLTADTSQVRRVLEQLPPPAGTADWQGAIRLARSLLAGSDPARREVVIFGDNQRHGWADEDSLTRWELLGGRADRFAPGVRVIDVAPAGPRRPAGVSVEPIRTSRAIVSVGQEAVFRTGVRAVAKPSQLRIEVDGKPVGTLNPNRQGDSVPLSFRHRFLSAGSHVVSVVAPTDEYPPDDRADLVVDAVPALPVLLVEGTPRAGEFLREALAPARDPSPAVRVRVIRPEMLTAETLSRDMLDLSDSVPRVLILADVSSLDTIQSLAIEQFLGAGGSVFVSLGPSVKSGTYHEVFHRGGAGWLPTRLRELVNRPGTEARPAPATFAHPAFELFRDATGGGLIDARFPQFWRLEPPDGSSVSLVAGFSDDEPWLVERAYRAGRVIVAAAPFAGANGSNFTDLPAFAPLVHELIYYLASVRSGESNLRPGQPLRFRPVGSEPPGPIRVQPPYGEAVSVPTSRWPAVYERTDEPGLYRATSAGGQVRYFVVHPDSRESDLTPCTDTERQRVAELVGNLQYGESGESSLEETTTPDFEIGWLLLGCVIGLLAVEVWATGRMAG